MTGLSKGGYYGTLVTCAMGSRSHCHAVVPDRKGQAAQHDYVALNGYFCCVYGRDGCRYTGQDNQ